MKHTGIFRESLSLSSLSLSLNPEAAPWHPRTHLNPTHEKNHHHVGPCARVIDGGIDNGSARGDAKERDGDDVSRERGDGAGGVIQVKHIGEQHACRVEITKETDT